MTIEKQDRPKDSLVVEAVAIALIAEAQRRNSEIAGHYVEIDEFEVMCAYENARAAVAAINIVIDQRIRDLTEENERLKKPEWFYNADDGEYTYGDVDDVVDDMGYHGVMRVGGAREVWKKWAAVRCVALDDEGDIDETEVVTFDNEADALKCWSESLAKLRVPKTYEPAA